MQILQYASTDTLLIGDSFPSEKPVLLPMALAFPFTPFTNSVGGALKENEIQVVFKWKVNSIQSFSTATANNHRNQPWSMQISSPTRRNDVSFVEIDEPKERKKHQPAYLFCVSLKVSSFES